MSSGARAAASLVSVVIPYYEAPEELRAVVAALQDQDWHGPLEIIVADDGSPHGVPRTDAPIRVVRQADEGFRAAAARNLGAREARGEHLVFLDADTVPEPGYLSAVVPHLRDDPRAVVVGTRLTGPAQEEPEWLRRAWGVTDHLRRADDSSWRYVISAVLSMNRGFFWEIGGFDGSLVGYGGEDWELGFRAWNAGARLVHEPAAIARHREHDWGARQQDAALAAQEKNGETTALAARITHPLARPSGIRFETADVTVVVPAELDDPAAPGQLEVLACAWLAAGDVQVQLPRVPELLRAEPRAVALSADAEAERGRVELMLHRPVVPGAPMRMLLAQIESRDGHLRLLADPPGADPLLTARTRRARALGIAAREVPDRPEPHRLVERLSGPQRLERAFAQW